MKPCVVIPTYNEADTIADIIRRIQTLGIPVVIVDDGSVDGTAGIARMQGAYVITKEKNEGKGAALITGFTYVLHNDFNGVITMDGDGQHLPEEIPVFLRYAHNSAADIIVGNRMKKKKSMPFVRYLTNHFTSWLISRIAGKRIPDTQCGFRFIRRSVLENILLETKNFEIESEMLIKAARMGYSIESVGIKTVYGNEKSRINPLVDTIRFFRYVLNETWLTVRPKR